MCVCVCVCERLDALLSHVRQDHVLGGRAALDAAPSRYLVVSSEKRVSAVASQQVSSSEQRETCALDAVAHSVYPLLTTLYSLTTP